MRKILAFALIWAALPSVAGAQTSEAAKDGFKVKPIVLDADRNDGATLAIEYSGKATLWSVDLDQDESDNGSFDPDAILGGASVKYKASGVIAASAERNTKDFLDALLSFSGDYSARGFGSASAGAFLKAESDQKFDQTQMAWGARVTWAKVGLLQENDYLALDLNYGKVDPGDDKARKTALGVTSLKSYDRFDLEALYYFPTGWNVVETVELNYRRFDERKAPAAIKASGLNSHELSTIRVGLPGDLFVAYSEGKLPFNRQKDKSLAVGLSYKLF